jgi:colicin import membrane protein
MMQRGCFAATVLATLLVLPVLPFAPVWAQATDGTQDSALAAAVAHRKAEHERIRHEREALAAVRQKEEAACYKQFAVEDCLRSVRTKARETGDRLRAQEVELNDAERREKAAERLRSIEEKQKAVPPPASRGQGTDATVRKTPADAASTKAQRDHDAEQRALQQRNRVQQHDSEQAARAALQADRASQARVRHAETQKAAEERRARVEKSQADAAAKGRPPAAPLPAPARVASSPTR